jgi:hypothetical protein
MGVRALALHALHHQEERIGTGIGPQLVETIQHTSVERVVAHRLEHVAREAVVVWRVVALDPGEPDGAEPVPLVRYDRSAAVRNSV